MGNIWKYGCYRKRYYLFHPWIWVSDLCRKIHWAWQRSIRGYADCDWWDMDHWMVSVLAPMFDDFAKHHCAYPAYPYDESGFTDYQWTLYLSEISDHLKNSSEEQTRMINEYDADFNAMIERRSVEGKKYVDEDGNTHHEIQEESPGDKAIRINYFERQREIDKWREEEARKAFEMIGQRFFDLWD